MKRLLPWVLVASLLGLGASRNYAVDIDLVNGSGLKVGGTTVIDANKAATFSGGLIANGGATVSALVSTGAITSSGGISGTTGTLSGALVAGGATVSSGIATLTNVEASGYVNATDQIRTGGTARITSTGTLTNIAADSSSFYDTGTFNLSSGANEMNPTKTITVKYVRVGKLVTLTFPSGIATAGSETTLTFSTIPAGLRPAADAVATVRVYDNAVGLYGHIGINTSGGVLVCPDMACNAWNSGTKGPLAGATISYVAS